MSDQKGESLGARIVDVVLTFALSLIAALPGVIMLPFSIPGNCTGSSCAMWGLFAFAALSPLVTGPVGLVVTIAGGGRTTRRLIRAGMLLLPASASGVALGVLWWHAS